MENRSNSIPENLIEGKTQEDQIIEENRSSLREAELDAQEYIEGDAAIKKNLETTLHYILMSYQQDLERAIKTELKWMGEGTLEENIKRWNEANPSSFKGGFLASLKQLREAIADGTISAEAPWLSKLKERISIIDILLLE